MDVVVITSRRMPDAMDSALIANRSKLLKLAENIKTRKKPSSKKNINVKEDPSYTNIEHLVFGTYRQRPSFQLTPDGQSPSRNANVNGTSSVNEIPESSNHNHVSCSTSEVRSRQLSEDMSNENVEITDDENDSCKQRPAVSRSRQKPPVQLKRSTLRSQIAPQSTNNGQQQKSVSKITPVTTETHKKLAGNQFPQQRTADVVTVVSNGCAVKTLPRETNKIVVRVSHSDKTHSSISRTKRNSNTVSGPQQKETELSNAQSIPTTSKTVQKLKEKTLTHNRTQSQVSSQKTAPQVATNRSANLRKSRLTLATPLSSSASSTASSSSTTTNKSQTQKSIPTQRSTNRSDGFPRQSSVKSSASSKNGSLSNSRNSLYSSRGSLNNVPAKSNNPSTVKVVTKNKPALKTTSKVTQAKTSVQRSPSTVARPKDPPPALPLKTTTTTMIKCEEKSSAIKEIDNQETPLAVDELVVLVADTCKPMEEEEAKPEVVNTTPKTTPVRDIEKPSSPSSSKVVIEDELSCIKNLPSTEDSSSDGNKLSERNYVLERPCRPLYTWYDTRKRTPSISPPIKCPPIVDEIDQRDACRSETPTRGNRLTTSLPKSFITSKFTALSTVRMSSETEPEVWNCTERRDSEPVLSTSIEDNIDDSNKSRKSLSATQSLNEGYTKEESSPSTSNNSPCGRPHGSTGCLRCNDGGRLAMELRLLHRDSPMPKSVRRVKASSSPPAFAMSNADLSVSESDLRRPWSHLYSEAEARRVLEVKSRGVESATVPNSTTSSCADLSSPRPVSPLSPTSTPTCKMLLPQMSMPSVFSPRCSSLRAHASRVNAMDSVLQKFRKSFSLRFQRSRRSPSPSLSVADGDLRKEVEIQSSDDVVSGSEENNTVFRFGPIVWRSSKERKSKNRKDVKSTNKRCSPDSGIHVEVVNNQEVPEVACSSAQTATCSNKNGSVRKKSLTTALSCASVDKDLENSPQLFQGTTDVGSCDVIKTDLQFETSPRHRKSPRNKKNRECTKLRRSVSQPLEMDKISSALSLARLQGGHSDHEDSTHSLYVSSDENDASSSDGGSPNRYRKRRHRNKQPWSEYVTYAEALWNHVTMDPDELPFKAGDLVAVLNCSDKNWWWGALQDRMGWFPAEFVRPRVNQSNESNSVCSESFYSVPSKSNVQVSKVVNTDQIRTNVIKEIVTTERDFVQHLNDVIDGYLKQMRKRPDMFPEVRINTIFGNVEQIYCFQSEFLRQLEECINWEMPHVSCVGSCFVQNGSGFQVYSEYCNNHPQAVSELQQLLIIPKFSHFFEACRLLQEMIDISLDGFLLTPVQKICKYPLQLAELLKFTPEGHPDRVHVVEALQTMRRVAHDINERKRRMECLEKLAAWQLSVEVWEGPDLLDGSSELIHSSDVTKVTSSWSRDVTLFLFDHQLIICKRDLLKRNTFCYKSRIDVDQSEIIDLPDGRDTQSGLIVRHAWRIFCESKSKWYTFCSKTQEEKTRWMKAFQEERNRVEKDQEKGFFVSDQAKITAMNVVRNKLKRSKSKRGKDTFPARRVNHANSTRSVIGSSIKTKTGSLPHGIILNKKKNGAGWFAFGSSNKKHKN